MAEALRCVEDAAESAADPSKLYPLNSLDRAISVLEFISRSDQPVSLAEICHRMGLHKSTAHRLLMVLERNALIERTNEHRFRLGLKLHDLGRRALAQVELRTRAHPHIQQLSQELEDTVHLSVLQKTSIVYLDKLERSRKVCLTSKAGNSKPVYCTSMGKAILAFQPVQRVEQIIERTKFVRYTHKTLCSRELLLKDLELVRERGYAIDDEEGELGVRCIGAPIFDENRRAIAAVSVSGLASYFTPQTVAAAVQHILRCSREISASLSSAAS